MAHGIAGKLFVEATLVVVGVSLWLWWLLLALFFKYYMTIEGHRKKHSYWERLLEKRGSFVSVFSGHSDIDTITLR